jgi:hypothetical protein
MKVILDELQVGIAREPVTHETAGRVPAGTM